MGECVLWGWRTGLGHHALMEHPAWVDWFSMPQNVSRGIYDVFSFMKSGKLMPVVSRSYWGCSEGSLWSIRRQEVLSKTNILFSVQFPQFWFVVFIWMAIENSARKVLTCARYHMGLYPLVRVMEVQKGMWSTFNTHTGKQSGFLRNFFIIHWFPFKSRLEHLVLEVPLRWSSPAFDGTPPCT